MRLVSVNAGLPREVTREGQVVTTAIFKEPVAGAVRVHRLNIEGDRQADLSVHGGTDKAVYAYPAEHYEFWRVELPGTQLPWGMFGENLTVEGLREEDVRIGDGFRIGSAVFQATQPRLPCYKLALKFGRDDIIKRFLASGRTGFYFSVVEEGELRAGQPIERIARGADDLTVADITRLYTTDKSNQQLLARAVQAEALPASWREYFRKRIRR